MERGNSSTFERFVLVRVVILFLFSSVALAAGAPRGAAPQTQPATGGFDGPRTGLEAVVRQAVVDALAIPEIKDGRAAGPSIRTSELLQFVIDDYKRRVGERAEGPKWDTLTYSIAAYDRTVHMNVASGTGVIFISGHRPAGYTMAVLDNPNLVRHALVQAILTDKDGGLYAAEWDLEWTATGWHSRMSITPTAATERRIPALVK